MEYNLESNEKNVQIILKEGKIEGSLHIVNSSKKLIIFAHGSGSSRFSPRNLFVAKILRENNFSTLLFDLLTTQEESKDNLTQEYRFDIPLLTKRLIEITRWSMAHFQGTLGYFGASTGSAAAFMAAASLKDEIKAIVSRGGRPDLALNVMGQISSPALLIVGGNDLEVIKLNQEALAKIKCTKKLEIIQGASHLFEEPNKLEEVSTLAVKWFKKYVR